MDDGSNALMENVVQYSTTGTIAVLGYRMLSSIVEDLSATSSSSSSSVVTDIASDRIPESSANTMNKNATAKSPPTLGKDWLWGWGRSGLKSSSSPSQYSTAGFDSELSLPLFTLQDVSYHDMHHDCWIVIYDRVYDITKFLDSHPGGDEVMLEYAGHDATLAFRGVGHSKLAEEALKPYLVGILVESERIWTRFFNMKSDVP